MARDIDPRDCQHGLADSQQDVIDRLRAEVSRMREVLENIRDNGTDCLGPRCPFCNTGEDHPKTWAAVRAEEALGGE